ncbi:MAG: NADPH-dependent FMN reductase [Tardiphaga sp.]
MVIYLALVTIRNLRTKGNNPMAKFKVAVIVGSNRRESVNKKLAQALAKLGAAKADFSFAQIDDLPIYNQDHETDLAKPVVRFKAELAAADAVLFVTPEHNRSIPAVLKNAIDWGGRPWGQNSWPGKVAAVTGASIGALGTAVAQNHLKSILLSQGMQVAGGEAYLTFKDGLIDAAGTITDESTRKFLQGFVDQFLALVSRPAAAQAA